MFKPPIVVIVGPTASGKSQLAVDIAEHHNAEIICADSRTVYKGMDIGTAKPSAQDIKKVRHHLLDVVEPNQQFTAADFKKLANEAIVKIWKRGNVPIVVGGTGLYIDALLFDYDFGSKADVGKRVELSTMTLEELWDLCRQKNIELPENYKNKRHVIRAIELGGLIRAKRVLRKNTLVVGLSTERPELVKRITQRVDDMFRLGVLQEAEALGRKFGWDCQALTANIYLVCKQVLDGSLDLDQAKQLCVKNDLNLAKRQMTWFKRNNAIHWGDPNKLREIIARFLDSL